MRSMLAAALVAAALVSAGPARAQAFGQYTGAGVVPVNARMFGAYLHLSEHAAGGLAQLRLSFYPNLDFGFQGGLTRLEPRGGFSARTALRVGGDLRWQATGTSVGIPADLAVGASLGIETADQLKVITLGPSVVVSRPPGGSDGTVVIPFAALSLLFSNRDAFGVEDTDISLPLRLGLEARMAPEFRLVAELQLLIADRYNDDVAFVTGVNLPF